MAGKEVKKHVAAIHIGNKLTLAQRKASNILLLNAYENLLKKEVHKIRIKDLAQMVGGDSHNLSPLKEALCQLATTKLEWNILDEDGKEKWGGVTTMLAHADFEKKGYCTYSYSPALREKLYNPEIYARINLKIQNNFSSGHALALYENCLRFRSVRTTGWIDIKNFRSLLGVERSRYYHDFRQLNAKVIKPAVEQINSNSDIHVEPEYKREKRKVVGIRFSIKDNPQLSLFKYGAQEELQLGEGGKSDASEKKELLPQLLEYGLKESQAQTIIRQFDEEYIRGNLDIVDRDYQAGKVANLPAYTIAALKADYRPTKSTYETKQLEKKQTAKKQAEMAKHAEERLEILQKEFQSHRLQQALEQLSEAEEKDLQDRFLQKQKGDRFFARWMKKGFESRPIQSLYRVFAAEELLGEAADEDLKKFAKSRGEDLDMFRQLTGSI